MIGCCSQQRGWPGALLSWRQMMDPLWCPLSRTRRRAICWRTTSSAASPWSSTSRRTRWRRRWRGEGTCFRLWNQSWWRGRGETPGRGFLLPSLYLDKKWECFLRKTLVDEKQQLTVVLSLPELILIGPIPLSWSCERENTGKGDFFISDNWWWCEIDFYMSKKYISIYY